MIRLEDGMILYHASYIEINKIELHKTNPLNDFGQGFYVTTSYDQAIKFVLASIRKAKRVKYISKNYPVNDGVINTYRFHSLPNISIHCFKDADAEWLHFVTENREKNTFPEILSKYNSFDIIGGKIADDQTARTLQLYTSGGYGTVGTAKADNLALEVLLPDKLQDQFCFKSEKALKCLEFVKSDRYGNVKKNEITKSVKEECALIVMRKVVEMYSLENNISYNAALLQFVESYTYEALFDFKTEMWKEGSNSVYNTYCDELKRFGNKQ